MYWSQYPTYHTNDNACVFNRMLGCNTELYDDVDKKWQWDRIIDLSATCYIKFSKSHYSYIKPINCQHIIDNINYCGNCVKANKSLDKPEVLDNGGLERIFNKENNDDYVSTFPENWR